MKKTILTLAFFIGFVQASVADENVKDKNPLPLTDKMDDNMKVMIKTYTEYLGKTLQLRATDLYIMGEGLLSHKTHPQCQADGKKAVDLAKRLYEVGQELLAGKEPTPKDMENFVTHWTGM